MLADETSDRRGENLMLDARHVKMRHGGVGRDAAVLSAIGIGP
jgi:transposase-like protein